jgi:hypothetical protein
MQARARIHRSSSLRAMAKGEGKVVPGTSVNHRGVRKRRGGGSARVSCRRILRVSFPLASIQFSSVPLDTITEGVGAPASFRANDGRCAQRSPADRLTRVRVTSKTRLFSSVPRTDGGLSSVRKVRPDERFVFSADAGAGRE